MIRDPRRSIWEFLRDCDRLDSYINLAISELHQQLDQRDRAFATEVIFGSVRQRLFLDHIIDRLATREVDEKTRSLLRMGLYETLFMDTADHAVVNEYVELAKKVIGKARAGFINATMRRATRERKDLCGEKQLATVDLAIRTSHPQWIVDAYGAFLGDLDLEEELRSHNVAAPVHLVAFRDLDAAVAEKSPLTTHGFRLRIPPHEVPQISSGEAFVQDEGSQIVCEIALATDAKREKRWLDLCAGPGGKFSYLAHFLDPEHLRGNEFHAHRAQLISARNPRFTIEVGDGRNLSDSDVGYERILIDAPCTGIGALRRRPDARWRRKESDLKELVTLQRQLMESAASQVLEGGLILYVTCSPHIFETKGQVADFLNRHEEFVLEPITVEMLPQQSRDMLSRAIDDKGMLQLLTGRDGTDAMFMALLRKRAAT